MQRKPSYPLAQIFLDRWSPRALADEPLSHDELMPLFEAARWAPSSYNAQPWMFVYAHKGTQLWQDLFNTMVPLNQAWASNAAVLVIVASRKNFEYNNASSKTHSFDAGAAWMSFALQGSINGLAIHAMEGFDYGAAKALVKLDDAFEIECLIAVGKPGNKNDLPQELQEREELTDRKPLGKIVHGE